jgi:Raf kinase inhibitor-like YbhB/YbcL family protein
MLFLVAKLAMGAAGALTVSSGSFPSGGPLPRRLSCEGGDVSPEIHWSEPPPETRSLALLAEDPDAPGGTFVHWVLHGLPPGTRRLAEGAATPGQVGQNDFGRRGYGGPCPPPGRAHHYHFKVFALDDTPALGPGAGADELRRAMRGHVLATGEVVGTFAR